jgi:hypothetical protein
VIQLGVHEEIQNLASDLAEKARSLITWLPGFKLEEREVMLHLLDYSLVRTR